MQLQGRYRPVCMQIQERNIYKCSYSKDTDLNAGSYSNSGMGVAIVKIHTCMHVAKGKTGSYWKETYMGVAIVKGVAIKRL